jgi:hypothetical protein
MQKSWHRGAVIGLALLAAGAILLAAALSFGTPARPGPGFLPLLAALLLLALAPLLWGRPAIETDVCGGTPRGAVMTLAGLVVFVLVLPLAGLVIAALALGTIAARATGQTAARVLLTGSVTGLLTVVVFSWGLGVPFSLWPSVWR